jgi:hypothetical protein
VPLQILFIEVDFLINFYKQKKEDVMKNLFTILFVASIFSTTYPQDTINVPPDYTTIQSAVDAANNGDIILVADGTYYENINYLGKAITVASHFLLDGDKTHIDSTIIDGNQNGSVVSLISGEDTTSILCGFTITGGLTGYNGGGIRCEYSGVKVSHNKIVDNLAFTRSGSDGGGIYAVDTNQNCIVIESNEILRNSATYFETNGGGIFISGMSGRICNNIISENCSNKYGSGGGICISDAKLIIVNNTIVNNTAGWRGGGLYLDDESIIMNNIIWGNTTVIIDSQLCYETENSDIYFSDIQGGWDGIGNIDLYPEFVDTANGDYHLANNSPCIGAAIDSIEIAGTWYYSPLTDIEGNPRPNPSGTTPDMGAYENGPTVGVEEDILSMNPNSFSLSQNFPNPFNPNTKIKYSIPQTSDVVIRVYDILGNEIESLVNEEKPAGTYEITWYAEGLTSGIYFYQLKAGNFVETRKMLLIK